MLFTSLRNIDSSQYVSRLEPLCSSMARSIFNFDSPKIMIFKIQNQSPPIFFQYLQTLRYGLGIRAKIFIDQVLVKALELKSRVYKNFV